ncbi:cysteine synthase-like isoform X1 [Triticum dicoccoides]|uniref:cysteine synthase-like isoform X1 n=1 Tax=Triticum dicoccoides TaxID=85692 RepID=UPI000E7D1DB3|nr:cysteine synthase-like isoform X1 [Triticum dicoccoides]
MEPQEGRKGIPSLLSSQGECIATNITQLIGWTPLIELRNITEKDSIGARLIGKIEPYQPLSSVKDRSALRLIEDAEEKGLITPGITTLLGVTSGNLGIGVAFIAAQKGYKFIALMPAKLSLDKQILMRYLGVEVVLVGKGLRYHAPHITCQMVTCLSPADAVQHGFKALLDRVEQMKKDVEDVYVLDQFTNPANPDAHFRWTGPEIWKDTAGKVDIFIAASGSGGTITGVGRYLKTKNPSVKLICVEPAESPVISGGEPAFHNILGIGPGFVPEILDRSQIDEIVTVTTQEAMDMARRLAREEGLLVGISSGANAAACLKVASREENRGKMIVTMFSSGAERYLNSELFAQVKEECVNVNMTF